jgi:hypothetical protein
MPARKKRSKRDIEKAYPTRRFVEKLRRLADALEQGRRFRIQVAGERVSIPPAATTITPSRSRNAADYRPSAKRFDSLGDRLNRS